MPLRSFTRRSLTILLLLAFGFAILGARQQEATSVKIWKSKEDFAQWKPLAQVELEVTTKGLILTSIGGDPVSYTHLRAHETLRYRVMGGGG